MAVFVYVEGLGVVDKAAAAVPARKRSAAVPCPQVMPDMAGYVSPLSEPGERPAWIEGRHARREELKRNNCREVDPSEYRQDDPKTWKGRR
jgi:hypothetical protein